MDFKMIQPACFSNGKRIEIRKGSRQTNFAPAQPLDWFHSLQSSPVATRSSRQGSKNWWLARIKKPLERISRSGW
jgi:hypothetical protein